jgi:hypothetical protein
MAGRDKEWVVDQIRKALADLPGIQTSYTQPIEMRISEMLTGARGDLAIRIFGPDNAELARIAAQIQAPPESHSGHQRGADHGQRPGRLSPARHRPHCRRPRGHAHRPVAGRHACADRRRARRGRGRGLRRVRS